VSRDNFGRSEWDLDGILGSLCLGENCGEWEKYPSSTSSSSEHGDEGDKAGVIMSKGRNKSGSIGLSKTGERGVEWRDESEDLGFAGRIKSG